MVSRRSYSTIFKLKVITAAVSARGAQHTSSRFNVPLSCVSRWLKGRDKIVREATLRTGGRRKIYEHGRPVGNPELEERLMAWLLSARNAGTRITWESIHDNAMTINDDSQNPIPNFKASNGFVEKFLARSHREDP